MKFQRLLWFFNDYPAKILTNVALSLNRSVEG